MAFRVFFFFDEVIMKNPFGDNTVVSDGFPPPPPAAGQSFNPVYGAPPAPAGGNFAPVPGGVQQLQPPPPQSSQGHNHSFGSTQGPPPPGTYTHPGQPGAPAVLPHPVHPNIPGHPANHRGGFGVSHAINEAQVKKLIQHSDACNPGPHLVYNSLQNMISTT